MIPRIAPQRLDLDFAQRGRRRGWAPYVLLAVALAFAAEVGWTYWGLLQRAQELESRLTRSGELVRGSTRTQGLSDDELAFARDTVRRLATPWHRLFSALEAAQDERVALTSIEPDAESGIVNIGGEARDYLALLSYVANLSGQRTLQRVYLVRHEPAKSGAAGVAFTVSAAWLGPKEAIR